MVVVTYEALDDAAFAAKYKELGVKGPVSKCEAFTSFPSGDGEKLMGPNKMCQIYIRSSLDAEKTAIALTHEHIHALQYILGAPRRETVAWLMQDPLLQAVR